MSLSYYYEFTAPAETTAGELEAFLRDLEPEVKLMGFDPTIVLNVPFDTAERREFAMRLGGRITVEDERLKGVAIPCPTQAQDHDPTFGDCRLVPEHGVVLVATDERGAESCFGFFRYPERLCDIHGKTLAETGLRGRWAFRDLVDTPDQRYRKIVARFVDAGYAKRVKDEYA